MKVKGVIHCSATSIRAGAPPVNIYIKQLGKKLPLLRERTYHIQPIEPTVVINFLLLFQSYLHFFES